MPVDRSFSFSREDDFSSQSPRGASGYQVASGSSYLPDPSRDQSSSPLSSASSPSSHAGPGGMVSLDSYAGRQQQQSQPVRLTQAPAYGGPIHDLEQRRMSAYRAQRQQELAGAGTSQQPRKPLPSPPQAEVSLDGQTHSIPLPPAHVRSSSPNKHPSFDQDTSYSNNRSYQPLGQRTGSPERNQLSPPRLAQTSSYSSQLGLAAAAAVPGATAGDDYYDGRSVTDDGRHSPYRDMPPTYTSAAPSQSPYRHSAGDPRQGLGNIELNDLDDDDDDPFASISKRKGAGVGAGAGAAAGGAAGFFKNLGSRGASGSYGAVPGGSGNGAEKGGSKSDWLRQQTSGNKRLKWMVGGLIVLVIVLAITGGAIGAVLSNKSSGSTAGDIPTSGTLTKTSPQIQALMNNPNLHKVFQGMDYSPLGTQYPDCLTTPPIQNNITADVAVLAQLTPVIRLYGTDCQQTEMVLNAIKDLELQDEVRIWGGIYLDSNTTTNARQMSQMYDVLDKYGGDQFEGVIVGNEVLFNEWMSETALIGKMKSVRAGLAKRGLSSLKVATGDLGSDWSPSLAAATDVVMANIHPFFGGVAAPEAASWTYEFWQNNNVILTQGTDKGNIISETGWPTSGGQRCTQSTGSVIPCSSSTAGAVAGTDELNTFMEDWICSSIRNNTNYFWFEAFDEPWKVIYDTKDLKVESKWGLMDVNRVLKPGIKIPDCGGATATLRRR